MQKTQTTIYRSNKDDKKNRVNVNNNILLIYPTMYDKTLINPTF